MNYQRQTGFSLAEVIVAAFLFIATVVGVLSVWTTHARGISKARMVLIANELGEQTMEECVAARYQNVHEFHTVDPTAVVPVKVDFVIRNRPISAEFFTIIQVTPNPEDTTNPIKEVKVSVQWTDSTTPRAGQRRSIDLTTELHRSF